MQSAIQSIVELPQSRSSRPSCRFHKDTTATLPNQPRQQHRKRNRTEHVNEELFHKRSPGVDERVGWWWCGVHVGLGGFGGGEYAVVVCGGVLGSDEVVMLSPVSFVRDL